MATAGANGDARELAVENLRCVGLGYIDFALKEPGWFEPALLIFDPHNGEGPAVTVGDEVPLPFQLLINALDGMVNAGALTHERRVNAEWACWSAVHGFSDIATRGPLRDQDPEMLRALVVWRPVDLLGGRWGRGHGEILIPSPYLGTCARTRDDRPGHPG